MAAPRLNIKRDCTHGGRHKHGTTVAYRTDRCRCDECRTVWIAKDAQRRKLKAYGRYEPPYVDAEPVRKHIRALMAAGMGVKRVDSAAGLHGVTRRILYGNSGTGPSKTVRRCNAAAILAVTVALADGAFIDGTGTRRRMQALGHAGWGARELSDRLGLNRKAANAWNFFHCELVTVRNAQKVAALYDELWNQIPPLDTAVQRNGYVRCRRNAVRKGWLPALAWDDDTINDPAAQPDLGVVPTKRLRANWREAGVDEIAVERLTLGELKLPRHTQAPERIEAIRRLAARGFNDSKIAERVGMTTTGISRTRERHGIPAGQPKETAA